MKHNFKIIALSVLMLLASCSKDENSATDNEQMSQELENTPLQANDVANNVVIPGGIKNDGTPPTPNEAITLDVSSSSNVALLGEGFDVSINSNTTVTGAYLQFKSNDGEVSDSYFDIDIAANSSSAKTAKAFFGLKNKVSASAKLEDDANLDVDFNANIEPGTFCYVICVYDAEGNISAPEEVCVTVESWGGNDDVVGKWNYVKEEETFDGETTTTLAGEDYCGDPTSFFCDSQEEIQVSYFCYSSEDAFIRFNENGTFDFESSDMSKILNQDASAAECSAVYDEIEDNGSGSGQWAYNKDIQTFILVIYQVEYTYDGETQTYTYELGEAEAFVETDGLKVEGNFLTYEEGEESQGYSYKVYYEKE